MNLYFVAGIPYSSDELYHHGIKGQKWGVRRFQNDDGTLTEAGKARYLDANKGSENFRQLHDAYSKKLGETSDVYSESKKEYSKIKNASPDGMNEMEYIRSVAYNESGYDDANKRHQKALDERSRNINPFRAKKLYNEMKTTGNEVSNAVKKFRDLYSNMTMEHINSLPKKRRDAAKAYAYTLAGFDW